MKVSAFPVNTSPRFGAKVKPEDEAPFKALIKAQCGEEAVQKFDPKRAAIYQWADGTSGAAGFWDMTHAEDFDIRSFPGPQAGVEGFIWVKVPPRSPDMYNPTGKTANVVLTVTAVKKAFQEKKGLYTLLDDFFLKFVKNSQRQS